MGYGCSPGNHMIVKYTQLVDAAMEIKLEATAAHLRLKEILSGDRFDLLSLWKTAGIRYAVYQNDQ